MHTMASSEDTEITLGVGKLLGLFFLLAAICGVFFAIGYSLGKSSGREQAANDQGQVSASTDSGAASSANDSKPSATPAKPQEQPSAAAEPSSQPGNLTFYKAVQQNDTTASTKATTSRQDDPSAQKVVAASAAAKPSPGTATATSNVSTGDVMSHTSPVTGPGTIVVQIAALTREDDAVSLAGALRKKNYNVFVVNNPVNNDKFYHVQVGPFATLAEAQAMKAKLVAEGYNPIIKR